MMKVRPASKADAEAWLATRAALWPDANVDQLRLDVARYFVAWRAVAAASRVHRRDDGEVVGMLELSLRPYADGCDSSPVPFIKAWYVAEGARHSGIGGALVTAAERWALEHGCTEMASDALLENTESERAHAALGFEEVERAIRFRKSLKG